MRIPKYWAMGSVQSVDPSGKTIEFSCWGWSDRSERDAEQVGRQRAERVLARRLSGETLDRYEYGQLPLREEIVDTIPGRGREPAALVTRNSYGALVLNAARAMFIDVDFPVESVSGGLSHLWRRFTGRKVSGPEQQALQKVHAWADRHREYDLRIYRTFNGLRCLVTNAAFDPRDPSTSELMKELDCDPLYLLLCQRQECFRARLTPKPWRVKMDRPPPPYLTGVGSDLRVYEEWQTTYDRISPQYTVCRLLDRIGSSSVHHEVDPILTVHDRYCLTGDRLPLA